jgi:ribonuclease HI
MTIHAFTDGASRGNPGHSGVGIILKDEHGKILSKACGYIGSATNNVAEYSALIGCLQMAMKTSCKHLVVHSDSELMVRQLQGRYKVKEPHLRKYFERTQLLLKAAPFNFAIHHIEREKNKEADELANRGIELKQPLVL